MRIHYLPWFYWFFVGLIAIGCGDNTTVDMKDESTAEITASENGGKISGLVLPPGVSPLIIVLRNGVEFASTTADKEGQYIIPNLPPGGYSLLVIATGFFTDISIDNLELKKGEVREASVVILRAQAEAAILLGQVIEKSNGQVLPDAEIQIECSTGVCAPLSAISGPDGNFSIELWSGLGANVNVRKLGYRTQPIQVQALNPRQKFNMGKIQLERLEQ